MPTNGNGQFIYPQTDWAQGKMKMARTDPLPDEPTVGEVERARGQTDYDVLTTTIGKEGSDYIRKWDGVVGHPNAPTSDQKAWQIIRKRMIDQMQKEGPEPSGKPAITPTKRKAPEPGQNWPWSVQT